MQSDVSALSGRKHQADEVTVGSMPATASSAKLTHDSRTEFEVRDLRSIGELQQVREFWITHQNTLYNEFEYFECEVAHDETVLRPQVFVVMAEGKVRALVLGRLVLAMVPWKLGYRNVFTKPKKYLVIGRDAVLGHLDGPAAVAFFAHLEKSMQQEGIPFAHFRQIDMQLPAYEHVVDLAPSTCKDPVIEQEVHRTLNVDMSFDEFYGLRTKREKSNIRWDRNKFEKAFKGRFEIDCLQAERDVEKALEVAEGVTSKSYQRELGIGFKDDAVTRKLWRLKAGRGAFKMYVIRVDEKPVAYFFCVKRNGILHLEYTSFDPSYGQYQPGKYLLARIIERACEAPEEKIIDYGFGEATYKRQFSSDVRWEANVYYFARTPRGQYHRLIRFLVTGLHRKIKQRLEKWKLLDAIRTKWRSAARKK